MGKMNWAIFKDSSIDFHQWEENDAAFYFDYDIPALAEYRLKFLSDGMHEVFFEDKSTFLEVKDGKFNIENAKPAIQNFVEQAGYWGTFIEGFRKKEGKIYVSIGS